MSGTKNIYQYMKVLRFLLPAFLFLAAIAACNKETEFHQTRFLRPASTALPVYGDQEWDSIAFQSSESYELSTDVNWCKVDEMTKSLKIPYANALVDCFAWLHFEPNTTGESRTAIVHLAAGEYSLDACIIQYPFLCITSPRRYGEGLIPLTCEADATQATLGFTAFGNWTLTLAESVTWLQLARTQGTAGENTVTVNILESNETAADRSAVVTLTSRGVSEPITITQKKRPETE